MAEVSDTVAGAGAGALQLEVVTRSGVALRTEVDEVQAPSVHGEFGVLPGHLPLLAALRSGVLSYRRGSAEAKRAVIGPGYAEVGPEKVLILSEHFVPEEEIDPSATREALTEERAALERLIESGVTSGAQYAAHEARIEWCEAQLALVELWPPGRRGGHLGGEAN